ncbi:MAG: hypothetical protein HeimC3_41870 [Candidatus Heimdallarchaeota archaeon LC_3]|nr:MAG: hypothetical protein HeimC3_41870 [Candidatus Heimdallarchaeota archaeon LC_3]
MIRKRKNKSKKDKTNYILRGELNGVKFNRY